MKNINILIFALVLLFSCKKQEDTSKQISKNLSDQISKIETNYEGLGVKDESKIIDNSPTTRASDEYINKMISEMRRNADIESTKHELKSSSGYVGVIKYGTCGSYNTFEIWMDGNDGSNNYAYKTGWTGDWTISGGNSDMKFCLVPDNFDYKQGYTFAVLKTSAISGGGHTIERYFDCEDSNNASWISLNNGSHQKPFNQFGLGVTNMTDRGNLDMFLDYYPDLSSNTQSFPDLGISYGVFGNVNSYYNGLFVTWEEQTNNTNYCRLDGSPITTSQGIPGVDGILQGYTGTNIITSRVY